MRVLRARFTNFRGFSFMELNPARHVCLVGEPGAGKSDIIEGLIRVLSADFTRSRLPTELDFYRRDVSKRAEVEVVLSDLGDQLEQVFFDQLELWNLDSKDIVDELMDPQIVDREIYDVVVRLCYRATKNEEEDRLEHWVDYPKCSDPDIGAITRVPFNERKVIKCSWIHGRAQVFDVGATGRFRELIGLMPGNDFDPAIGNLESAIEKLASQFSSTAQMSAALEQVLSPCRVPLGLLTEKAENIFRLLPEGGSASGLMKSLSPAVDLQDGIGMLPLQRHGSTIGTMLRLSQALATAEGNGLILVDDFGEELVSTTAQHLASIFRRSSSQIWLSTRRHNVAEAFSPDELIRLGRDKSGQRQPFHGRVPISKQERLAARHRSLQLLPAIGSIGVIIVEGPHDKASLISVAQKLNNEKGVPLPSGSNVSLIDAGTVDGSGGSSATARLAAAARELGLRVVTVIDHDRAGQAELEENLRCSDCVIRLPPKHAVEVALLSGLSEPQIKAALRDIEVGFGAKVPKDLDVLSGRKLISEAVTVLKSNAGFHAQFVDSLPPGIYPSIVQLVLEKAVVAVVQRAEGLIEL